MKFHIWDVGRLLSALGNWYTRGMLAIGCLMLICVVLVMGADVFFRYVLNNSIIWAEEMSRYLLIWITFLLLGVAYQRGELISLTLLLHRVPKKFQVVLTIVAHVAGIATLLVIVWYGLAFAKINAIQSLPAFDFIWASIAGPDAEANVSAWWVYGAVPIGAGLLSIHMAIGLVGRVRGILGGTPLDVESAEQKHIAGNSR